MKVELCDKCKDKAMATDDDGEVSAYTSGRFYFDLKVLRIIDVSGKEEGKMYHWKESVPADLCLGCLAVELINAGLTIIKGIAADAN